MQVKYFIIGCLFLGLSVHALSQDTLPNFTAKQLGNNRMQISWVNPYETCIQINVQRSFDSTKNFKTVFSTQSPELPMNGFVDKAPYFKMYYRIFYVLQGGAYFFTKSKLPDSVVNVLKEKKEITNTAAAGFENFINVYINNQLIAELDPKQYKRFRDSIATNTKDTLFTLSENAIDLHRYNPWIPSVYVYANAKGYVTIDVPKYRLHKYKLIVFEENGNEVFEIKHIKEALLVLDKANFFHAGWYNFELYEDDKLKDKNKFFLSRD